MSRRHFLHVLAAASVPVLLPVGLGGCAPPPILTVALHPFPGYEMVFLGRSLGLLDQAPVHLVETPSASASSRALVHGMVDAAALTLDEALLLLQKGVAVSVVLVFDTSAGADMLLAHPKIASLRHLAGHRIGVEVGAVGALMLDAVLEAAGLKIGDVTLVPLPIDRQLAAWKAGQVDAVITFDPVATEIAKSGAALLFDSAAIPGRIVDVLVMRRHLLGTHGAGLRRLLAAHFAAARAWSQRGSELAPRLASRLGLTAAEVPAAFSGLHLLSLEENRRAIGGNPPALEKDSRDLVERMIAHRLLETRPALEGFLRPDFLPLD